MTRLQPNSLAEMEAYIVRQKETVSHPTQSAGGGQLYLLRIDLLNCDQRLASRAATRLLKEGLAGMSAL